ncbi:cytosol non-specific dipeptidase [Oxobacter pfennigii]|uniref:Cytosol non-specific dipeptidase n=1 Tax=Oxobacter pfennigii TaxID=36849 RepID=A0A0P8X4P4_9CLOT|nr:cytosol non-specific dipeptidase [Oxobacter pfennigii]
MTDIYKGLDPEPVFKFFQEISSIPRGSGNEKAISDYMVEFARARNLHCIQDEALNIIIKKPGNFGYENAPTVIIQGHMDMVCDKNKETRHDFEKDPIKLRVEGDMLYANNTTLGADNGIAVAYGLALLDSKDIPHPPLEVLLTTEEETGLIGASALDMNNLTGKYLINIDSEEEGYLLAGCAGGVRTKHCIPISWEDVKDELEYYIISIKGLKGGHSGADIHLDRGNSNKLMGRALNQLQRSINYSVADINGGFKMNAIPREADAVVAIEPQDNAKFLEIIDDLRETLKNELRVTDSGFSLNTEKYQNDVKKVFSEDTKKKVIMSLLLIPNGVMSMSHEIQGLVVSSSNLGVVTTDEKEVCFESAVRSSVKSLKYYILSQTEAVAELLGAEFETSSDYPEWEFEPNSKLRTIFEEVYESMYGKNPVITAVHGGLECGLFKAKRPDLDMVSMGPNLYDVHTPNEHLSISSTRRVWEYLLEVLKSIK